MKKLFALSVVLLLAAGCSNSKPQASAQNQNTSANQQASASSYTMAQVAAANDKNKCWTAINGNVYDLTGWISKHPGGPDKILSICGKDGTSAFENQHGSQSRPNDVLATFKIGTLQQ